MHPSYSQGPLGPALRLGALLLLAGSSLAFATDEPARAPAEPTAADETESIVAPRIDGSATTESGVLTPKSRCAFRWWWARWYRFRYLPTTVFGLAWCV